MVNDVILMSGGLDSTCIAFTLKKEGKQPLLYWMDYGQRNALQEHESVKYIADRLQLEAKCLYLPGLFVHAHSSILRMKDGLPHLFDVKNSELVGRNLALLSIAVANMPTDSEVQLYIGCHKTAADYKDCTQQFIDKANDIVEYETSNRVHVLAPFINMTKQELVQAGKDAGMTMDNVMHTTSCYLGTSCGMCPPCKQRAEILKYIF